MRSGAEGDAARDWAYMIDQCSSLENRMQAVIHTVDSLTVTYARALVLDWKRLKELQDMQAVIQANRVWLDALVTDVRPIVAVARIEKGLAMNPSLDSAHFFLGMIALDRGEKEEARGHFEKSLQSNPGNEEASEALGKLEEG